MKRSDLTEKLLDIKRDNGWSWKYICEKIGGFSDVLIVGAILGQMKLTKPQAANAAELFGLSKSEAAMLNETPMRGEGTPMPPTDPLIYRFYELVMVNGPAWKALIEEELGDGYALGGEIADDLVRQVGIADCFEVGRDDGFGVRTGGIAREPEPCRGPQSQELVATGHSLEFQFLVEGKFLLKTFFALVEC